MAYRVDLTERAIRDLRRLYQDLDAEESAQARSWFLGLERIILGLAQHPSRAATTPEDSALRHLLYGRRRNIYRIIYAIDESSQIVTVLHIRHGARGTFQPEDEDS